MTPEHVGTMWDYIRENQQMRQLLFNVLIMCGGSYMFRRYIAILRERS
jgi:hypothetical protein